MIQAAHPNGAADAKVALGVADDRLAQIAGVLGRQAMLGPSRALDDETISRVRGLAADLAGQLVGDHAVLRATVCDMLAADRAILLHLHALAVETRLIAALATSRGLDPVLPPLVQRRLDAEAVGTDAATLATTVGTDAATLATTMLAAQSRIGQSLRHMRLPLGELPRDLQHLAHGIADHAFAAMAVVPRKPAPENDTHARLSLLRRMLEGLGDDLVLALRIDQAGVPLFFSALALASGHPREAVALACVEDDPVRLALLLRAAGLNGDEAAAQLVAIRPDADPSLALRIGDTATAGHLLAAVP